MRARIEERVRKASGQRLCHSQVRDVTVGNQERGLRVEELGQIKFQPLVKPVIARGRSRSGDIQSKSGQAVPRGAQHFWMTGQPEVIAAAKIGKPLPAVGYVIAIDLLDRRWQ